jgi:aspartate aminotransferase-like enzyme
MLQAGGFTFKLADTPAEYEQIHALNYRTFVTEIPQHQDSGEGRLVDKFHHKNAYIIALYEGRVVGMLSVHDQPPFSIADRLSDPSILQRPGTRPLEVRLLAIEPEHRNSFVFYGLTHSLYEYSRDAGYTHLYISGLEERLHLYQQIGFETLGPAVRSGTTSFVPMVCPVSRIGDKHQRYIRLWHKHIRGVESKQPEPVCLLPGPVTIAPVVHEAFRQPPTYHRGSEFITLFQKVRRALGELVGDRDVALFNGSGTLANEVVAATLAADSYETGSGPRGLLLVNGEFGQRLARQAVRHGLRPRVLSWEWGQPWNLDEMESALAQEPLGSWVWGVHQESSTGVLNDLPGLVRLARAYGARVCMDCVSSVGAVPVDLSDVYLATAASGKALGAYAGAGIVFADGAALADLDTSRVPSYFDLKANLAATGPIYTFPSPTLKALAAALAEYATPEKARAQYERYAELGAYVRRRLREVELEPLADESCACPVVTTFAPPGDESAAAFVARCRSWGFAIGGQSGYLAERRLVQIATMGAVTREMCAPLFERLAREKRREARQNRLAVTMA